MLDHVQSTDQRIFISQPVALFNQRSASYDYKLPIFFFPEKYSRPMYFVIKMKSQWVSLVFKLVQAWSLYYQFVVMYGNIVSDS